MVCLEKLVRRGAWLLVPVAAAPLSACEPTPPPNWASGGAPLVIAEARWERPGDDPVEILANGQVLEDGDAAFSIDRAGRVVDEDNAPIAILLPDGQVIGPDHRYLGHVGIANAAPPGSSTAWLALLPDGNVVRFDYEGDRHSAGRWQGCNGPQQRTCTLVTHLFALRRYAAPAPGMGVGIGVGIGVWR